MTDRITAELNGESSPRLDSPPLLRGCEWSPKSGGFDLRRTYYAGSQRRRRYIGHIGGREFAQLRAQYQPLALRMILAERFLPKLWAAGFNDTSATLTGLTLSSGGKVYVGAANAAAQ